MPTRSYPDCRRDNKAAAYDAPGRFASLDWKTAPRSNACLRESNLGAEQHLYILGDDPTCIRSDNSSGIRCRDSAATDRRGPGADRFGRAGVAPGNSTHRKLHYAEENSMRLRRNIRSSCTATRGLSIVRNVRSKRCSEMLGAALALFLVGIVFVTTAQAQLRGGSGNVRVNIEWHEDVDLDLYVTDPCGDVLGYGESRSRSCHGFVGEWDYDDQGNGYRDDNPNAENIVWSNGAAVGGYTVDVKHFDGDVTANYTVRIFYGDRSETHSGQIGPNSVGRQRIAQFVADESVNASTLTLSARPISIAEDAGTSAITVTGELDRAAISNTVVTVTVGAQGDTAEEGTDYATVSDLTLTIPEGQTSATTTFALTPIDDDVAENDEALSISGSDSSDTEQLPLTVTETTDRGRRNDRGRRRARPAFHHGDADC